MGMQISLVRNEPNLFYVFVLVHHECGTTEWRCLNGQCIPENQRCDVKHDCVDLSDELDCGKIKTLKLVVAIKEHIKERKLETRFYLDFSYAVI